MIRRWKDRKREAAAGWLVFLFVITYGSCGMGLMVRNPGACGGGRSRPGTRSVDFDRDVGPLQMKGDRVVDVGRSQRGSAWHPACILGWLAKIWGVETHLPPPSSRGLLPFSQGRTPRASSSLLDWYTTFFEGYVGVCNAGVCTPQSGCRVTRPRSSCVATGPCLHPITAEQ